jgi:hypothetical protein
MIALVWLDLLKHAKETWETLQRSGVQLYPGRDLGDAGEPVRRVFQRYSPRQAVDLVALLQQ